MDCLYINLDAQTERRDFLEKNFAAHKAPGWDLHRVAAYDVAYVEQQETMGLLSKREKACCLSHVRAIEEAQSHKGPVLILEDDAAFGPHSCPAIDQAIGGLSDDGWDIVYTDLGLGSVHQMVDFIMLRRQAARDGEMRILNLADIVYFGATAYIVNEKIKPKLLDLVAQEKAWNIPFDLFLREMIVRSKVRGCVLFPFPTTTSAFSTASQVQPQGTVLTDFILDAYRKIIWNDRDIGTCLKGMESFTEKNADPETRAYATILGAMLSEGFKTK